MLKVFNTLSNRKEEFKPISGKKVGIFVCGPTVYDYSHIGHARTYTIFDVIVKYLRHKDYEVKFVMNITDIDDKIIARAREENKTPKEVAEFYEEKFMEDIKALGIDGVDKFARATEHIPEIISQIEILLKKDYAYVIENEGIYFDIARFKDYGKLAKRKVEEAEDAVSRIDESVNKRNRGDFALWRFSKPGEPEWESPWGKGRPGWHIEDTAITEKYLGQQYEIHCGARDLIFPHHEAEIAQQEAASGKKPFVKYWLHTGFLTRDGRKMSKSLGNFITIRDILKEYSPEALRFMAVSAHYRSPIDFGDDLIKQSEAAVMRIKEFGDKIEFISEGKAKGEPGSRIEEILAKTKKEFEEKMDDDFNTPEALAALFKFIKEANNLISEDKLGNESADKIRDFLKETDKILGIIPEKESGIPDEVAKLAERREELRKQGSWDEADEIRKQINNLGYSIEDTPFGPFIKKQKGS